MTNTNAVVKAEKAEGAKTYVPDNDGKISKLIQGVFYVVNK